jgi:hypothetical protein
VASAAIDGLDRAWRVRVNIAANSAQVPPFIAYEVIAEYAKI